MDESSDIAPQHGKHPRCKSFNRDAGLRFAAMRRLREPPQQSRVSDFAAASIGFAVMDKSREAFQDTSHDSSERNQYGINI